MNVKKLFRRSMIATAVAAIALSSAPVMSDDDDERDDDRSYYDRDGDRDSEVRITFAHSGDFHGDYHPHTNGRADNAGQLEGGMARAATVIKKIRYNNDNVIHVHTGDTIHGSGEASITKGEALVRMVDQLGIDVSTPGNWEFAYSPYRYMQFFGVHDRDGNNMDIKDITDADRANNKMPKPIKYSEAEEGTIPTYGASFRKVKYVKSYNADGTPNMASGYNRWGMVASNVYENGSWQLYTGVKNKGTGMNLTPPYRIIKKDGVKIGFIGCTTNRGPQVVSSTITSGVTFSNCKGEVKFPQNRPIDWEDAAITHGPWIVDTSHPKGGYWQKGNKVTGNPADANTQAGNRDAAAEKFGWDKRPHNNGDAGYKVVNEIVKWTKHLREVEGVDLVAVMSEAGIAENVYAAENLGKDDPDWNGPDIYFSSDMHEEMNYPAVVTDPRGKKVIILENSEDMAQIGELDVTVKNGKITKWAFTDHDVNETVRPDWRMKGLVSQIDQEIADLIDDGKAFNPYNGHKITYQLNEVVGSTKNVILERNRFTTEFDPKNKIMPGVIEGTGHDLVTDMFRKLTGADVGGIRGFRYTNSVLDGGDITYKSLYHFFPIGAQVAVGSIPTTPTAEANRDADGNPIWLSGDARFSNSGKDNPTQFVAFPRSLQQEMELAGNSTMNPNIPAWGGGWFWSYSGVKLKMKPTGANFDKWGTKPSARISSLELYDNADPSKNGPINEAHKAKVKYASYYYHEDYNRINRNQLVPGGACPNKKLSKDCVMDKTDIRILAKAADGDYVMVDTAEYDAALAAGDISVLDAVEALGRYIKEDSITVFDWDAGAKAGELRTVAGLGETFNGDNLEFPRVTLVDKDGSTGADGKGSNDLTDCSIEFGSPCIQPLRGAEAAFDALVTNKGVPYIKGTADTPAMTGSF